MTNAQPGSSFEPATEEDWQALVSKALNGAPLESLASISEDGHTIQPIYVAAECDGPIDARVAGSPWSVRQTIDLPDAEAANRQAIADLEGGANGLNLVFAGAKPARFGGLAAHDPDFLSRVLEGVHLDMIALRLEAGAMAPSVAAQFLAFCADRGHDPNTLDLDLGLGFDPIGTLATTGRLEHDEAETVQGIHTFLEASGGASLLLDGRVYHDAGATDGQELACTIAMMVHLMRLFEGAGVGLESVVSRFSMTLSADVDQFATIAKMRAARLLWRRVLEASDLEYCPLSLHAETSWRMMTAADPHTNILRTTIAAFSAGIGGADSVTVLPFTVALGLSDEHARRIARNTQLILIQEANLGRVLDPSAGSGALEAITSDIAHSAWQSFQAIEREGGIITSLVTGSLQNRIVKSRTARAAAYRSAERHIIGTTLHQNPEQAHVAVSSSRTADDRPRGTAAITCTPLVAHRAAKDFEEG